MDDAVRILYLLFHGMEGPCGTEDGNRDLGDVNGDSELNLSDPLYLLNYLFTGGPAPAQGTACVPIAGCPSACQEAP